MMVNRVLIDVPELIETTRLHLQMPKAGFGSKLHEAILDGYADYVRWLNWPLIAPDQQSVEEECRRNNADFILRDFIRYIIIEKVSGDVIGRCALPPFQAQWLIPQFGISYFVRRTKRNSGYATESAHALALMAFRVLHARKLEIYCDAENVSSCKVAEKLGFNLEYEQRGGWPRQDKQLAYLRTYAMFSETDLPSLMVTW